MDLSASFSDVQISGAIFYERAASRFYEQRAAAATCFRKYDTDRMPVIRGTELKKRQRVSPLEKVLIPMFISKGRGRKVFYTSVEGPLHLVDTFWVS